MNTYTIVEALLDIIHVISRHPDEMETDNEGQLIVYTGIYRQSDGSYADQADPTFDNG
jgi:hypothetical protein